MTAGLIWLIKLFLAHLITDFILQPTSWIGDRNKNHFRSQKLYLHGAVTGLGALALVGWQYWPQVLIIMITHGLIDGWKSYQKESMTYFLVDQLLHFLVITACWFVTFPNLDLLRSLGSRLSSNGHVWIVATAAVFLTSPAGILIGKMTKQWQDKIEDTDSSLANAGKWIGIAERIIVLLLVLQNQFSAIGLLVTAKGIIRFNEKDRPEAKTEYLVIGTLLSIGLAIAIGLCVKP